MNQKRLKQAVKQLIEVTRIMAAKIDEHEERLRGVEQATEPTADRIGFHTELAGHGDDDDEDDDGPGSGLWAGSGASEQAARRAEAGDVRPV